MATEITMPKLSDTMTEGVLTAWRINVGQRVERGDILAEVETDKANMELESFVTGVLLEIRAKPGDTVPVGAVLAVVGEEGEKPAAKPEKEEAKPPAPPEKEAPRPTPAEAPKEAAAAPSAGREMPKETTAEETGKEAEVRKETGLEELGEGVTAAAVTEAPKTPAPAEVRPEQPAPAPPQAEKASPLVRRLAREKDIDLSQVKGSGPEGRILKEDLEKLAAREAAPGEREPRRGPKPLEERQEPLSRMRAAVSRKVTETWQTTPHFAVTVEIDMGEAERLYRGLKEAKHPVSLNDFILKACAEAIKSYPTVNAFFSTGQIAYHNTIDIGVVVALEEGLIIPIVHGCDRLSLLEIAAESRRLAELARSGKISEDALRGGTFTVSNLGMYGIDEFFAVINSPQSAILAVGAVTDKPCVRNGEVVAGRLMRATLSADHRLLDGATAAQFMTELKRILESPVALLV